MKLSELCFILIVFAFSCTSTHKEAQNISDEYPPIFPDYTFITIPPNIAPLNFGTKDAVSIRCDFFAGNDFLGTITGKQTIRIPLKKWKGWLEKYNGKQLNISVSAWTTGYPEGIKYKNFTIDISSNPIDEWVAYRLIEPGYEFWNQMGIYQRQLSTFTEKEIVTNKQNHNGCMNCHSFHNYSSKNWMFHARGQNGATILVEDEKPVRIEIDKLNDGKSGTYPMWHPSGKYIVFSSNDTHQSFYHAGNTPVEVYDLSSDLIIYDVENNRILSDSRFTDDSTLETFPAFSPDGNHLYFCSAKAKKMPMQYKELKYALLRVDFNEKTGILGENIDTLYNPAITGGSVSFPRISPDNRYLLYTEAACATFPIWHKEADLKMIRLTDGQPIDTKSINSEDAESYHAWSSNSRWIIFSSRRLDGRYTRLYIAGIDENGNFTKPFLIPQKDPEHNTMRLKSYNIPEFTDSEIRLDKLHTATLFD